MHACAPQEMVLEGVRAVLSSSFSTILSSRGGGRACLQCLTDNERKIGEEITTFQQLVLPFFIPFLQHNLSNFLRFFSLKN
ncbi:unnamed protein product [Ectocarpus sp. 6 AP-2014]